MIVENDGVVSAEVTLVKNPPRASASVEAMEVDEFARRLAQISPDNPWAVWTEGDKHHAVFVPTDAVPPGVYVRLV